MGQAALSLSFHHNHWLKRAKLSIADAAHHHQMLRASKGPVLVAMRNDSLSGDLADPGKSFQFLRGGGIDVYQ